MICGQISKDEFRSALEDKLCSYFGKTHFDASDEEIFQASAMVIREIMSRLMAFENFGDRKESRKLSYLSMEFMLGRSLQKNAFNLGILDAVSGALKDLGRNASDIFEAEPDAGLGNGGLGRLAACFMDSLATQGVQATGYSLCYELGVFAQDLKHGEQREYAEEWSTSAESWLLPVHSEAVEISFGGTLDIDKNNGRRCVSGHTTVLAVPRDMLIVGFGGNHVNKLRLWDAKSPFPLDMYHFFVGDYVKSLEPRNLTEVITKVLYPADDHRPGKLLRLKQQYFFVSASAQDIVRQHLENFGTLHNFAEKNVIQINDTHPSMIIPELMRIFMDEHLMGWDEAYALVSKSVAYTNHTVMPEALETWPADIFAPLLPRIHEIILEFNRRQREFLAQQFSGDMEKVERNAIISNGMVHMAQLCLAGSFFVNGVSELHGDIIKNSLFKDLSDLRPDSFGFVTNGIDHRRWLSQINPELDLLLRELLGSDYLKRPEEFTKFLEYENDSEVLLRLLEIKAVKKKQFAEYIFKKEGTALNPDFVFDVQIKRLHEYKRQLMCGILIMRLQNFLRQNPDAEFRPRVFIFGAKAAPGYHIAKRIIQFLLALRDDIEADEACRGKLKLVFVENYSVSVAEMLVPATDISEQISTAGMEASGTGNMKLMMNGAVTIGTLDGANVEMFSRLGDENMFIFGLKEAEVEALRASGEGSYKIYEQNNDLRHVLDRMREGVGPNRLQFGDLFGMLVYGGDYFMVLADSESYYKTHLELYERISDPLEHGRLMLNSIAQSGIFAADRSIRDYREKIWRV